MFLLFGIGLLPWLIILVASVIIAFATEFDEGKWATGSLFVGAALVFWLAHSNPFAFIGAHALLFSSLIAAYFVAGIVWGFFKWYLFNLNIRDKIRDGKVQVEDGSVPGRNRWDRIKVPLTPADHKTRIVGWMTYWPWSLSWFLINDPVRRAWNAIYNRLVSRLQAVSNHVFKNVTKNVAVDGANTNGKA